MPKQLALLLWAAVLTVMLGAAAAAVDPPREGIDLDRGLAAHWPLAGDAQDRSGHGHHAAIRGNVDFTAEASTSRPPRGAAFNGRDAYLEIQSVDSWRLGKGDFSLTTWVHTEGSTSDVPGDLISQYDPVLRRGVHLTIKTNAGVASSQANYRQLQFGVDDNQTNKWADCGRPGEAILAFALVAHDGELYAGTCEPLAGQAGHVYRYAGDARWVDCGSPAPCNAVTAMAVFEGRLYAGVGKYRLAGSSLVESPNANLGGRVYRYEGDSRWTDCGPLSGTEAVGGMVVFRGRLYASSLYKPAGFFRYEGDASWRNCPTPEGKRVEALGVYNGFLYATSYDGGHVYRFDGEDWTDCGQLGDPQENTQTYSFAVYGGRLYVGTWRSGRVYRFDDVNQWTDVGRLGEELEVMGMLVHNGRLLAGTLPLAEVYEYDGRTAWRRLAQLDNTPDVRYRRAWTMAEHGGQLFCSTLPSGKIFATAVGTSAAWEREFPPGWQHVAAIKRDGNLRLYVAGQLVGESKSSAAEYDLSSKSPLRIGFGPNDYFCGRMRDVRLYQRALNTAEIKQLAAGP